MLQVVREFGIECLHAAGNAASARGRHAEDFLRLAQQAEEQLVGLRGAVWVKRLERDTR